MTKKMSTSDVVTCDTLTERIDDLATLVLERDRHVRAFNLLVVDIEFQDREVKRLQTMLSNTQEKLAQNVMRNEHNADRIMEYNSKIAKFIDGSYLEAEGESDPVPDPNRPSFNPSPLG